MVSDCGNRLLLAELPGTRYSVHFSSHRPSGLALRLARAPTGGREGKAAMPAPETALTGDELLAAVTEVMVGFHERYYHRAPATAKTLLLGDELLVCVLGGIYTDVEKTLIELQRKTIVQETRSAFQSAMQDRFIAAVEGLSGRSVAAFISNQHVGPDIEVELFMLASRTTGTDLP